MKKLLALFFLITASISRAMKTEIEKFYSEERESLKTMLAENLSTCCDLFLIFKETPHEFIRDRVKKVIPNIELFNEDRKPKKFVMDAVFSILARNTEEERL